MLDCDSQFDVAVVGADCVGGGFGECLVAIAMPELKRNA
jgi:hypothetical protein